MLKSCTEDFQVVWADPSDADLHWGWDKMHGPRPLPALAADISILKNKAVFGSRIIVCNGYLYSAGFNIPGPTPEVVERGVHAVWFNEYVPRIRETATGIRSASHADVTAAELADS